MIMKMNKLTLAVISLTAAVTAFTSCERDDNFGGDSRAVALSVKMESGVMTRSAVPGRTFETVDLSDKGVDLYLLASESLNTEDPFQVTTRGAIIDQVTKFPVNMIGTDNSVYASGEAEQTTSTYWSIFNGRNKVNWPEDHGTYSFFAYVDPANAAGTPSVNSMSYAGMPPAGDDASKMQDFLMAYTTADTYTHAEYHNPDTYVPIHFQHALAAIRVNFDLAEGVSIKKVTINNVYTVGTATATGKSFPNAITWSDQATKKSYSQEANLTASAVEDRTFFIVPQTLTAAGGNEVTITYLLEKNGVEYSFTTRALGTTEWKAGYIYNYTLSSTPSGTVGIQVQEDFDGETKKDVRVANVKTSATYVRVAVIANWYNSASKVVEPLSAAGQAAIAINTSDKGWFKSGAYYYYKYPVNGHDETENLINEFKNTLEAPQSVFALHLEVNVIAQGVEYEDSKATVTAAWGSTVADQLKKIGQN